jgi:S-adenosylhomocysteine hydrolase
LRSNAWPRNHKKLEKTVHRVPDELDKRVSKLKLESMGIKIDRPTPEQGRSILLFELARTYPWFAGRVSGRSSRGA